MLIVTRYKTKKDEKRLRVMLGRLDAERIADAIAEVAEDDTAPNENVLSLVALGAELRRSIRQGNDGGWMANGGNVVPEEELAEPEPVTE